MAKFRMSKLKAKVTKKMTLNYLASFQKFLEIQLEANPDISVPDLIEIIDNLLKEEEYDPPAELEESDDDINC